MTGSTARDIVNQATKNAARDRVARVAAFVLAACLVVAGIYFGPRVLAQGHQIDTLSGKLDTANQSVTKLADQVTRLGGTPVVQPPPATPTSTASVDPAEVRQAARTAVAEYCAAPTHPCRGSDGSTPPLDAIVDAVIGRIPAPKNGTDGQDGRDAPVPDYAALVAAYCGQTDEPCRGPAGQKGDTGAIGATGAPGPTCPDGYELRDAVITAQDGTTYSGKACVDPNTSAPPSTNPPLLGGS